MGINNIYYEVKRKKIVLQDGYIKRKNLPCTELPFEYLEQSPNKKQQELF